MTDIIIIGAGPAGMTAALYAARSGYTVSVLEGLSFGGQIALSPSVENFPSIKEISGVEFTTNLMMQITDLGVAFEFEKAISIEDGKIKKITTESGKIFECKAVIVATGATHRHLGLENEEKLIGKGVSYCAVCDGAFFKDKDVAVVGGGDTALQDALYLAKICKNVYLIHRRDEFRGGKSLVQNVKKTQNITICLNSNVSEIHFDDILTAITVKKNDGSEKKLDISGLFIAVGQIPQVEVFSKQSLDESGYFDVNEDTISCCDGIFIAGDCRKKEVRQLTTAVADGSIAATAASNYLSQLSRETN